MFKIQTLNAISKVGLQHFPQDQYKIANDITDPDAIIVRSQDMHKDVIAKSVKAIGRAGAGTNNIPVAELSKRGVPVFNAPGANANAVKELVIAGLLMAARNIVPSIKFVENLDRRSDTLEKQVEGGKKNFAGFELPGHTLGIIGLGKIGSLVADAAIKLGMNVIGFDPEITVDAAWSLHSQVKKAASLEDLLKRSDFVTLHVPLLDVTRGLINAARLNVMKADSVLLNFSREGVVDEAAVLDALDTKKIKYYVCDFPTGNTIGRSDVIALPHLGASTEEAEDNSATMVVEQVRDYLENGNIMNAVNFPNIVVPRESNYRLSIANANVPNMLGQISTTMAAAGLNINTMANKAKRDMAYTLVDVDSPVSQAVIDLICGIEGVLSIRYLPLETK